MILILAISAFTVILWGLLKFLFQDFYLYLRHYVSNSYRIPKCVFFDYGEFVLSFFVVFFFAICSFFLYKMSHALIAWTIGGDLIGYFTIVRNVFTSSKELQFPNGTNLLGGMFISPGLEFLSLAFMIWAIRNYAGRINKIYHTLVFSEGDIMFFEILGALCFVLIELIFYSQEIPFSNQIAQLLYLACSKLALISFIFAIEHARYLKSEYYRSSFKEYFNLTPLEKFILLSPRNTIIFAYSLSILMNCPNALGQQWFTGWKLLLSFSANILLFTVLLKVFFAKSSNYLAVVLMAERHEDSSAFPKLDSLVISKKTLILAIAVFLTVIFGLLKLKLLFFISFILLTIIALYIIFHTFIYLVGFSFSILKAKLSHFQIPTIRFIIIYQYLQNTIKSSGLAILPMIFVGLFTFFILSLFPKHFELNNPEVVNAIIDKTSGFPLFIEEAETGRCVAIPNSEVDSIFCRMLINQEDRQFAFQDSWMPQLSNWHGLSISGLRVLMGHSGSSNINMQVLKNLTTPRQDISRKFSESLSSFELSIQKTPKEIYNYYVNCVSFGGGLGGNEGIYTSSLYFFGRPVRQLNPLELFFLVSSLKRGKSFKTSTKLIPYSEVQGNADVIKQTLLASANSWQSQNLLTKRDIARLKRSELRFTNRPYKTDIGTTTREFLKKQIPSSSTKKTYYSSITINNQEKITAGIRSFENKFKDYKRLGIYDLYSSAIAVDIKSGHIIGNYGGKGVTDLTTFEFGMPIASLIKPFVLLEMLEQKLPVRLFDGKISTRGKTPENFNRKYSNQYVGLKEIIKYSKNAPIFNIREVTSPIALFSKVEDRFTKMGILKDPYLKIQDKTRLQEIEDNYGLGSRNMRLIDIAQIYQALLNNGKYVKLTTVQSDFNPSTNKIELLDSIKSKQIYSSENARIINEALTQTINGGTASTLNHLLPKDREYYIKTGTSDRAIHGYCALSDGDILLVTYVTYGKVLNGRLELNETPPIPFKSGGRTAGVLAALIYNELTSNGENRTKYPLSTGRNDWQTSE